MNSQRALMNGSLVLLEFKLNVHFSLIFFELKRALNLKSRAGRTKFSWESFISESMVEIGIPYIQVPIL